MRAITGDLIFPVKRHPEPSEGSPYSPRSTSAMQSNTEILHCVQMTALVGFLGAAAKLPPYAVFAVSFSLRSKGAIVSPCTRIENTTTTYVAASS